MAELTAFFASLDSALFIALPYVAIFTFFWVSIQRYRKAPFTVSSLSSQLLENKKNFWAVVPFHFGILFVFFGHLLAFLVPRAILGWNDHPIRLYILEITALSAGILAVVGMLGLITRRISDPKLRVVTSRLDMLLYTLLLIQLVSGVAVAIVHPWGSTWFATSMTPYLWSLVRFQPDVSVIATLPWLIKLHVIGAFLVILLFPFTRLMHVLVAPLPYLWRKPQVVRWYGRG